MELRLNEKEVKKILLEWAQNLFPMAIFNEVEITTLYGQVETAIISRIDPQQTKENELA